MGLGDKIDNTAEKLGGKGLPRELFEAARIDGASYVGLLRRIALPLSSPSLVVIFISEFQASWNSLQSALIYLNAGSVEGFTASWGLPTP